MRDFGIGSWTARRARVLAGKPALVEDGCVTTFAQWDERAVRLAHGLRERGVGRGDRVAYLGLNSVDFAVSLIATAKLGAVFLPLNTRLAAPEVAYILRDAHPRVLLWKSDFAQVADVPEVRQAVEKSVRLETDDATALDALAATDAGPIDEPVGLDDMLMIQYTSGTSGRPKGVQLRHGNVVWNIYNLLTDVDVCTDEVALVTAPLFHTAALNQVLLPTLLKGGTSLIEARFDAARALRLIAEHRVTMLFGVTSMYLALAAVPGFADADLSSLRSALTGGAPVPEGVLRLWADRGVPLFQGYGMTESSPGATMLRGTETLRKLGSAGPAVFFSDVRVVRNTGEPVDVGEPGEVQISGPNVTAGYWGNPEATADAFTDDGFLRSGDVAVVDDDGYLRIVDRLKDIYISGGENVSPAEVEEALHAHPSVADCAVVGVPDEQWGEVGRAFVVRRDGAEVTADELIAHVRGRLARYKVPKSIVFRAELPHNASGKLLKSTLRKLDT